MMFLLQLAWAAGKGVKGKEYKEYFDAEQGVAFIPWSKLGSGVDLQALGEGSWIDSETLPPGLQNSVVKEGITEMIVLKSNNTFLVPFWMVDGDIKSLN